MNDFDHIHLARLSNGHWQASLRRENEAGWKIGFGVTLDAAILDAAGRRTPQFDPGPPEFEATEEDPLS